MRWNGFFQSERFFIPNAFLRPVMLFRVLKDEIMPFQILKIYFVLLKS